jgi:hypothetical protein
LLDIKAEIPLLVEMSCCPLEVEQVVSLEMLDEEHERSPQSPVDHNVYTLPRAVQIARRALDTTEKRATFDDLTKMYLSIYLLTTPYVLGSTTQSGHNRPQAAVFARRRIAKGKWITNLVGRTAQMSEQEIKEPIRQGVSCPWADSLCQF